MAGPQQPIAIMAVVDMVGALATGSMSGNLYLLDTNGANGSTGLGTEELKTEVKKGDQLHWTVLPLECEAYVSIDDILIDKELCEPQQKTYPGTDVTYWVGTIKKDVDVAPYNIKFKVGTRVDPMTTTSTPFLVGVGK